MEVFLCNVWDIKFYLVISVSLSFGIIWYNIFWSIEVILIEYFLFNEERFYGDINDGIEKCVIFHLTKLTMFMGVAKILLGLYHPSGGHCLYWILIPWRKEGSLSLLDLYGERQQRRHMAASLTWNVD